MSSNKLQLVYGGTRYALVSGDDVHRDMDEHAARRLVATALRNGGPQARWMIEDLAQRLGGWNHDDPISTLVEALVSGRLVAVNWNGPVRLMSEAEHTDIREIGGGEVIDPMIGGDRPEPQRPQQFTWLSFEVEDDRGEPIERGRFDAAIDGRAQGGPLDGEVRRFDTLRKGTEASIHLEGISWPFDPNLRVVGDPPEVGDPTEPREPVVPVPSGGTSPGSNDPRGVDDPVPPSQGFISFDVVDEDGVPLVGGYTLVSDGAEVVGQLSGVCRHDTTSDTPAVRLHGLVLPFVPTPKPAA